jgi:hypothetical protein
VADHNDVVKLLIPLLIKRIRAGANTLLLLSTLPTFFCPRFLSYEYASPYVLSIENFHFDEEN